MLKRFLGLSFIFGVIFYAAYPGWTQDEFPVYKAEILQGKGESLHGVFAVESDEVNLSQEMVIQAESIGFSGTSRR